MTDDKPPSAEWRNFYGRIHGKTLRPAQKVYLSEDLASLRPAGVTRAENPARDPIDPSGIFGDGRPIWLEIGFGGGEHLVHMAARYPEIGIVGCEPFVNGVAMLLGKIRQSGVTNLAVHPGDARDLMEVLPDASVSERVSELSRSLAQAPPPPPPLCHAGSSAAAGARDAVGGGVPCCDRYSRLCAPDVEGGAAGRVRPCRRGQRGLGRLAVHPL